VSPQYPPPEVLPEAVEVPRPVLPDGDEAELGRRPASAWPLIVAASVPDRPAPAAAPVVVYRPRYPGFENTDEVVVKASPRGRYGVPGLVTVPPGLKVYGR